MASIGIGTTIFSAKATRDGHILVAMISALRRGTIVLALAAVAIANCASAAEESAVSDLATPPKGVAAGGLVARVSLDEDWTDYHKLRFKASLTRRHSEKVWLQRARALPPLRSELVIVPLEVVPLDSPS